MEFIAFGAGAKVVDQVPCQVEDLFGHYWILILIDDGVDPLFLGLSCLSEGHIVAQDILQFDTYMLKNMGKVGPLIEAVYKTSSVALGTTMVPQGGNCLLYTSRCV